jgi:hypothetical protein
MRLPERLNALIVILKEWLTLGCSMCVERERECEVMRIASLMIAIAAMLCANSSYAYDDDAAFACRATSFYALNYNTTHQLSGAEFFTIKLRGQKAYFDNDGYFDNSVNDVVFNLAQGLETRSVTSHFKLKDGQFWYAMATMGYAVMGQGRCSEL